MKHNLLLLFLLISVVACNNNTEKETVVVKDSVIKTIESDSAATYVHDFSDTVLQEKITDVLMKLPFVKKSNNFIDSFSNHKHSIAFMMNKPEAGETEIQVQAGYNGNERFETYYRFFVNPKNMQIKVYDPVADKKLTIKEFLKTQQ
jgi:hypothetical protein